MNCSICGRPKKPSVTGSFTQWLSSCNCESDQSATVVVCARCGQKIDAVTTGEFTQWVLASNRCSCEEPVHIPVSPTLAVVDAGSPSRIDIDIAIDDNTRLDLSNFPVDRYEPIKRLGFGGAGIVYLCKDTRMNKEVAVKVLRATTSTQVIDFQEEARLTARVEHSNLVSILDIGATDGGSQYMVLEYVDGIPLDRVLAAAGSLEESAVINLFTQISDALEHAHAAGVFHRDIKASNTLIKQGADGVLDAFIIDFGIAYLHASSDTTVQGNTLVGTPKYMSPDQMQGIKFDARSEIYSVGCLMYEALTGRLPFTASEPLTLLEQHATAPVPPFAEVAPELDLTDRLERIVLKCLAKAPENRFQSMKDLNKALRELEGDEGRPLTGDAKGTEPKPGRETTFFVVALLVTVILAGSIVALFSYSGSLDSDARKRKEEPDFYGGGFPSLDNVDAESRFTIENKPDGKHVRVADNIDDRDLLDLKVHDDIVELNLNYTRVTDKGLSTVAQIKSLKCLKIRSTPKITASGIRHLRKLPHLRTLYITGGSQPEDYFKTIGNLRLTDVNFRDDRAPGNNNTGQKKLLLLLKHQPELKELELSGVGINDSYFDPLIDSKIERLTFAFASISDEKLMRLENMKSLKMLRLRSCIALKGTGASKLQTARPDLIMVLR